MRGSPRFSLVALALLAAGPLFANGWQGLYTPSVRAVPDVAIGENAVCVREILDAQRRYNIPDNLLLGIGLQEAGLRREEGLTVWPWAVNAAGEGRVFDTRAAAIDWVKSRLSDGVKSVDVGCMQVNLYWHPKAFETLEESFDPYVNVDYAAQFLRDLYYKTGEWELAAGSYHSFTPELRKIYLASLKQNVAVANARIDDFRKIASDDGFGALPVDLPAEAAPAQVGILWSSGMSQLLEGDSGTRSIYSKQALQPLLPTFERAD